MARIIDGQLKKVQSAAEKKRCPPFDPPYLIAISNIGGPLHLITDFCWKCAVGYSPAFYPNIRPHVQYSSSFWHICVFQQCSPPFLFSLPLKILLLHSPEFRMSSISHGRCI